MCRGQCNAFFRQKKIVDKQECQYRRELEFPYSKLHVGKHESAAFEVFRIWNVTFFSILRSPLFSSTSERIVLHFAVSVVKAYKALGSLFQVFLPNTRDLRDPPFFCEAARISADSWYRDMTTRAVLVVVKKL